LGTRNKKLNALITPDIGLPSGKPSMTMLQAAAAGFFVGIAPNDDFFVGAIGPGREARTLFRASALQYSAGDQAGARKTAALMNSQDTFVAAMKQIIAKHFGVAESDVG
jgi:methenyltetrahydromethanopterin cyclohydrolase